ncbi:MAG: hypothetical protein WC292_05025 [Clostridia bacterium]
MRKKESKSENADNVNKKIKYSDKLIAITESIVNKPDVKIYRDEFLKDRFSDTAPELYDAIIEQGPIMAGYDKKEIHKKAKELINERAKTSSKEVFHTNKSKELPITQETVVEIAQHYKPVLMLAQELAYLYGEEDLWTDNAVSDKVKSQILLYCGVMFGVAGAPQLLKALSNMLNPEVTSKIFERTLNIIKKHPTINLIIELFSGEMTKKQFDKLLSKAIPVVGGAISGGAAYLTMRVMGARLVKALEKAKFDYTEKEFNADLNNIIIESETLSAESDDIENIIIDNIDDSSSDNN